jgi:hypothetical protein
LIKEGYGRVGEALTKSTKSRAVGLGAILAADELMKALDIGFEELG